MSLNENISVMTEILKINNISKKYKNILALQDLSLSVKQGEVYGILGPNGSGKTTTLSIISGIIKSNSGTFSWFGEEESTAESRKKIGTLIETPNFYPYLSLQKNLEIIALIKEVDFVDITRVLEIVNLENRKKSLFKTLSLGMKQRLAIASVLLGNPEVLVLDEPTNGLDPEGIAEIRNIILAEAQKGKTILLASHILDEVEKVCGHVAILKNGKLLASGSVDKLLNSDDIIYVSSNNLAELFDLLVRWGYTKTIEKNEFDINLTLQEKMSVEDINKYAFENGIVLNKIFVQKLSLESQFLEIIK